jgi:adenosylcobinamide-GDP ribazoletransferase
MFAAFAFLTVFGNGRAPGPRALTWFPVVGLVVGIIVGGSWWLLDRAFPSLLAAALVVTADLVLTGALHVDGLADTADGLLPHATRARRLEIMWSPDIGAFGAAAVVTVLLTRTTAFAGRPPAVLLAAGIWCASRTIVAVTPAWLPYARDCGIASPFLDTRPPRWPVLVLLPAGAFAIYGAGLAGGVAIAATVIAGVCVLALARSRIGGFTGDVLGAAIVVSETVGLAVAAARW